MDTEDTEMDAEIQIFPILYNGTKRFLILNSLYNTEGSNSWYHKYDIIRENTFCMGEPNFSYSSKHTGVHRTEV